MANTFHLQIVTPDGLAFDGETESLIVKTTQGDVGILSGHADYFAAISVGRIRVKNPDGSYRKAAVNGGFLRVTKEVTRVVATSFEWADQIDLERAQRAKSGAEKALASASDPGEVELLKLRLRWANNRINVVEGK